MFLHIRQCLQQQHKETTWSWKQVKHLQSAVLLLCSWHGRTNSRHDADLSAATINFQYQTQNQHPKQDGGRLHVRKHVGTTGGRFCTQISTEVQVTSIKAVQCTSISKVEALFNDLMILMISDPLKTRNELPTVPDNNNKQQLKIINNINNHSL